MTRPLSPPTNDPCAAARDLLAAYALDTADAVERGIVEQRLRDCPELAEELAALQAVTAGLHYTAGMIAPPPELGSRLMQRLAPPAPPKPAPLAFPRRRWLAAVAAGLALLLLTNGYWLREVTTLRDQLAQTPALNPQGNLLNYLGTGGVTRVDFAAASDLPTASLAWSAGAAESTWIGLLAVRDLPPLPAGTYQLWLIRSDTAPFSAGLFNVEADGSGFIVFEVTEPLNTFDLLGITAEPSGGSPAPTTDPVLLGELRGSA